MNITLPIANGGSFTAQARVVGSNDDEVVALHNNNVSTDRCIAILDNMANAAVSLMRAEPQGRC